MQQNGLKRSDVDFSRTKAKAAETPQNKDEPL